MSEPAPFESIRVVVRRAAGAAEWIAPSPDLPGLSLRDVDLDVLEARLPEAVDAALGTLQCAGMSVPAGEPNVVVIPIDEGEGGAEGRPAPSHPAFPA